MRTTSDDSTRYERALSRVERGRNSEPLGNDRFGERSTDGATCDLWSGARRVARRSREDRGICRFVLRTGGDRGGVGISRVGVAVGGNGVSELCGVAEGRKGNAAAAQSGGFFDWRA